MKKVSPSWTPTPLEVSIAQIVTLKDVIPAKSDALFIHAPASEDVLDKKLLLTATKTYKKSKVKKIVINGIPKKMCKERGVSYQGYEKWLKFILDEGVPKKDVIITPPNFHTASESAYLLSLAKEQGWKKIIIVSHPHHQLRCFLQAVAIMQEMDFWPGVYNLTHDGIAWHHNISKPIIDGKEKTITGNLRIHINSEFERIVKYAQHVKNADFTRNATIPEMLAYLDSRK